MIAPSLNSGWAWIEGQVRLRLDLYCTMAFSQSESRVPGLESPVHYFGVSLDSSRPAPATQSESLAVTRR